MERKVDQMVVEMVTNNLADFTTEELTTINKSVVAEIRSRRRNFDFEESKKYRVGDLIKFKDRSGEWTEGTIKNVNQRTATLEPNNQGVIWRVAYSFLRKAGKEE